MKAADFSNKRLLAVDYGLKRIGIATCDELHITVSPLKVLDKSKADIFQEIFSLIESYKPGAIVLGVPYRLDGVMTEVIQEILNFKKELSEKINIPIIEFDESFSTIRATETLISIGRKKKKRSVKGEKDKIAAAIILRDFLNES